MDSSALFDEHDVHPFLVHFYCLQCADRSDSDYVCKTFQKHCVKNLENEIIKRALLVFIKFLLSLEIGIFGFLSIQYSDIDKSKNSGDIMFCPISDDHVISTNWGTFQSRNCLSELCARDYDFSRKVWMSAMKHYHILNPRP